MMTISKTQAIRMIDRAYDHLPDMQDGFRSMRQKIFNAALAGEKQHRRAAPQGWHSKGFSTHAAARYFVVKFLREFTIKPHTGGIVDILHMRDDACLAAAVAAKFAVPLIARCQAIPAEFDTIDYAAMMH